MGIKYNDRYTAVTFNVAQKREALWNRDIFFFLFFFL